MSPWLYRLKNLKRTLVAIGTLKLVLLGKYEIFIIFIEYPTQGLKIKSTKNTLYLNIFKALFWNYF